MERGKPSLTLQQIKRLADVGTFLHNGGHPFLFDRGVVERMGDIGRVDADGFVELVGRAKDMIISGGFNIYAVDLEDELFKEPDVVEAAVIGMPSERWGETPVGFVILSPGARDAGTILVAVNARLGKIQRLSALHAIGQMPRSHIGKLLKSELRERAEGLGNLAPPP